MGHMLKFQKGLRKAIMLNAAKLLAMLGKQVWRQDLIAITNFISIISPKIPRIGGRELASFKGNSSNLLAQLKLFEESQSASKSTKTRHG